MKDILKLINAPLFMLLFFSFSCEKGKDICITEVNFKKNESVGPDIIKYSIDVRKEFMIALKNRGIERVIYDYGDLKEEEMSPDIGYTDSTKIFITNATSLLHLPPIPHKADDSRRKSLEEKIDRTINSLNKKAKLILYFSSGDSVIVEKCR